MKKKRKTNKPISAMAQVGGKVNAGIMDGICLGGGMCEEGAEAENTEYNIGYRNGDDKMTGYAHIDESKDRKKTLLNNYKKYIKSLFNSMVENGYTKKPAPKIILKCEKQSGPKVFSMTGYYDPETKEVVAYIRDRHIKDCLRSIAHEFIHHSQNIEGRLGSDAYSGDKITEDDKLIKLEEEAYLKGNIAFRKWTETMQKKLNLNESVMQEMSPEDVSLESFNIKRDLNPKFWKDEHLDKRIRLKLLDIADDFFKDLDVDWIEPKDIIMTGSLANYNWDNEYSDIDLHIMVDFEEVDDNKDFVKNYFDSKKTLWNQKHEGLTIFGFPVEVYVQDVNETHNSSGIYSLDKDEWIEEPDFKSLKSQKYDKQYVKKEVAKLATEFEELEDEFKKAKSDKHKIEIVNKKAIELFDKIKGKRTNGFEKSKSEMNPGNIIFKSLRRNGIIEKLLDLREKTYDMMNSL